MKLITDTHTLVWALCDSALLGANARNALAHQPYTASVVNLWELILKSGKPGALVNDPIPWWDQFVVGNRIPTLPIRTSHLRALAKLGEHHRDPFDRLLIAQALAEGFAVVTKDEAIGRYGVTVIW